MEFNNYITFSISAVAIVVSIFAYIQNSRVQKRQLRINKIEEILEITHMLNGNYHYFEESQFIKSNFSSSRDGFIEKEKYKARVKILKNISDELDFSNKLPRLYVLSNSYLSKKRLRDKIGILIAVFTSLLETTLNDPHKTAILPFNKFPKKMEFLEFVKEIQNELIIEMGLGYKNKLSEENLYEEEFRERYNLK